MRAFESDVVWRITHDFQGKELNPSGKEALWFFRRRIVASQWHNPLDVPFQTGSFDIRTLPGSDTVHLWWRGFPLFVLELGADQTILLLLQFLF